MLRKIIKLVIILAFPVNNIFAANIPVIVITPGKTVQSYSTVGSTVSVIDNNDIEDSQYFFLADTLNNHSTGINLFQMGLKGNRFNSLYHEQCK